jgi:hypothetical protein
MAVATTLSYVEQVGVAATVHAIVMSAAAIEQNPADFCSEANWTAPLQERSDHPMEREGITCEGGTAAKLGTTPPSGNTSHCVGRRRCLRGGVRLRERDLQQAHQARSMRETSENYCQTLRTAVSAGMADEC